MTESWPVDSPSGGLLVFHVTRRFREGSGPIAFASPAAAPDERVAIWGGLPPVPLAQVAPQVAPIVVHGEVDGHLAYVEQVPGGVLLSELALPAELAPYVVHQVFLALQAIHAGRQVHGAVAPEQVIVGPAGEVVLAGRGRVGGMARLDVEAALGLWGSEAPTLTTVDAALAALEAWLGEGDAAALGALVRQAARPPPPPMGQLVLAVGSETDEVVPDLGPDSTGGGILDRWGITATAVEEDTATSAASSGGSSELSTAMWGRLASRWMEGPEGRFDEVAGVPSRAVRSIIAEEPPWPLPSSPYVSFPLGRLLADGEVEHTSPDLGRLGEPQEITVVQGALTSSETTVALRPKLAVVLAATGAAMIVLAVALALASLGLLF